jgi:hypothetical protein
VNVYANNPTDLIIDINGYYALPSDTTGNTALGSQALQSDTSGQSNTAVGVSALAANTTGNTNTAVGANTLQNNTSASFNTAFGSLALFNNTTGGSNTVIGFNALQANTTGSGNIAIGVQSANSVANGNSNNIHIGNLGANADAGVIRIGTAGTQTTFFVSGVRGVTPSQAGPVNVVIDSNGQLGTQSSSRRFKEDIEDMGDASSGLLRLRPVTFRYRQPYADGSKPLDYGLIAEEVAEVYPDLAVKGADGEIETVQYQKLNTMLLNEVQKQHQEARQQRRRIEEQQDELRALKARLADLEGTLEKLANASANR